MFELNPKPLLDALDVKVPWIVALSGGCDSVVLLDLLLAYRQSHPELQLSAVHINHHLQDKAKNWEQFCQQLTAQATVPLQIKLCTVDHKDEGIEAAARQARYRIFEMLLQKPAYLFLAHHADDLTETVLLQLLRGAGAKGLSAMTVEQVFAYGHLVRPLLNYDRETILQYAHARKLQWIEDPSNLDERYQRNYLRHQIIPRLKQRWPSLNKTTMRTARLCAETEALAQNAIIKLFHGVCDHAHHLLVESLRRLDEKQVKAVVRYWLTLHACQHPNEARLVQGLQDLLTAKEDRQACLAWGKWQIRRYQQRLYLLKDFVEWNTAQKLVWDLHKPLVIEGLGVLQANTDLCNLEWNKNEAPSCHLDWSKNAVFTQWRDLNRITTNLENVEVRFRQGGEHIKLADGHHHLLKKLFQQWRVPYWERDRVPLLFFKDELIAVVGYVVSSDYQAAGAEEGWLIDFCKP